jgi:hypothetical protein
MGFLKGDTGLADRRVVHGSTFSESPSVSYFDISPRGTGREFRFRLLPRLIGRGRSQACDAEGAKEPISDPGTPRTAYPAGAFV